MPQATRKMIQRGHVILIKKDPLTLRGITSAGIRYLRDTKVLGIAGYVGIRKTTLIKPER